MNTIISKGTVHKAGSRISLPIKYDFKYKVLTPSGYEVPVEKQVIPFSGNLIKAEFSNGESLFLTPDHRHVVFLKDNMKEVSAESLRIGDESLTLDGEPVTITKLTPFPYTGKVYDFTVPSHLFYAQGIMTHNCCRLRLDKRELRKRGGGLFGSAELTGSVGVVTLNLPRIGYLANDETDFYSRLDDLMDVARDSLEIKRKVLTKNLSEGLYPYTKAYISSFDNFFSTIGLVGMNEACRNLFGSEVHIGTERGKKFAVEVLNHMRDRIANYQVETGNLYNLESTPAESTCYRLALHDKKKYPDIITAGTEDPYYTNSSNLPVGYSDDPWLAIEHQEGIQTLYTGGCVTLETVVDLED